MTTKTYRSDTILNALQQVQAELGPDAIIVSVREVPGGQPWQVWRKTSCEVIATTDTARKTNPWTNTPTKGDPTVAKDGLAEGIEWIEEPFEKPLRDPASLREKKAAPTKQAMHWMPPKLHPYDEDLLLNPRFETRSEFDKVFDQAAKAQPVAPKENLPAPLKAALDRLLRCGLDPMLVERMKQNCLGAVGLTILEDEKRCEDYLKRLMEAFIRATPQNQLSGQRKVLCLVGPSGSGKTSTCARLAAYSMRKGKRVAWINTDTVRAGAVSEARSYAEALNIPLLLTYVPDDLLGALASQTEADLILVDTPGFNPYSEAQISELGALITQIPGRITYLLAAATMKEADLGRCLTSTRLFNIDGMIVTKLDETGSLASVFNFAWQSQLAMAFTAGGKQVVEDFSPANPTDLVNELFKKMHKK